MKNNEPIILTGDFNTVAKSDEEYYKEINLESKLSSYKFIYLFFYRQSHLKEKLSFNGSLYYEPMNRLLENGFIDMCKDCGTTTPTNILHDQISDNVYINYVILYYLDNSFTIRLCLSK